jgi:hypothetical protein
VYLSSIRHKLEPEPAHPRYFLTEPRSGVRFDPGEPSARQGIAPPTTLEADRLVPRWLGPQRA